MMKRQRVSRACDTCRAKKDRCDGARPSCSTCSSLQRTCSYKTVGKKRGVPTGYLRTLELLWGLVLRQVNGSEEVVRALLKSVNIQSQLGQISKDGEGSNALLTTWKNSPLLKEIERVLSLDEPDGQTNRGSQAAAASSASPDDHIQLMSESWQWNLPEGISQAHEDFTEDTTFLSTENAQSANRNSSYACQTRDRGTQADIPQTSRYNASDRLDFTVSGEPRELRLPGNARQLFDIYFTYTNSWLPIIEKHEILRTAFSYGVNGVRILPSQKGSGDHAALWAIMALASFQHPRKNGGLQHPQLSNPDSIYRTARWLIPYEDGLYEPGHAQALLVLSLVKLGQQKWSAACILIGIAIRIAMSLGLLHPSSSKADSMSSADRTIHGRSKHVFLACFVLDTLVSMEMGCRPLLKKEDAVRIGPLEEDGLEEWHPWEDQTGLAPNSPGSDFFSRGPLHAPSTFNRLVSLACILNDFCCPLGCAPSFTDTEFADIERQMRHWASNLEVNYCINLEGTNNHSVPTAPHILGLHLAYEGMLARIALDRQKYREKTTPAAASNIQAVENFKRLVKLLKAYVDNYGPSATSPTFLMFLPVPCRKTCDAIGASFPPDLSSTLHAIATQLSLVWIEQHYTTPTQGEVEAVSSRQILDTAEMPSSYTAAQLSQGEVSPQTRNMSIGGGSVPTQAPPVQQMSSVPWNCLDPSSALSLQPPTPSLIRTTTTSGTPSQNTGRAQASIPLPTSFPSPFHAPDKQFQQARNDPNMNAASFVHMDEYSASGPARIAPDLDALLDELDYLEGSDR